MEDWRFLAVLVWQAAGVVQGFCDEGVVEMDIEVLG